jgi:hypothetical protein
MSHKQKHTNLPMNSFETKREEGWYGYFDCYIDMDGHNPILFPGLYRANSGHLYESGNRLGALHGQAITRQYVAVEKKKSTMVRHAHHPEQRRRTDFFFSK